MARTKRESLNSRAGRLGHGSYDDYLRSEHWRAFRGDVLRRYPQCRICRGMALVVHHLTYERLGEERIEDVVALCPECHDTLHVVHRKRGIPLDRFSEAVKWTRRKLRCEKPKPKVATVVAPPPPPPVLANPETFTLYDRLDQIKKLVRAGYKEKWIATRYGWNREDVHEVVVWLKPSEYQDQSKYV